jgi:hypothetical protein
MGIAKLKMSVRYSTQFQIEINDYKQLLTPVSLPDDSFTHFDCNSKQKQLTNSFYQMYKMKQIAKT